MNCPDCKFPIVKDEYYPDGRCSEFCEQLGEKAKEIHSLKTGEWGFFPCSKCGCVIEDEYDAKDPYCSDCWPKIKFDRTQKALQDALRTYRQLYADPIAQFAQQSGLGEERAKEIFAISEGKFE